MDKVILVDASGSMAEEGKKSVVKYVLYAIDGAAKVDWRDKDYKVVFWNENISDKNGNFVFSGTSSMKALEKYYESNNQMDLLIISDGCFPRELGNFLKYKGISALALAVGCDCNKARLMKTVGNDRVYNTTDVVTCLNEFMQM